MTYSLHLDNLRAAKQEKKTNKLLGKEDRSLEKEIDHFSILNNGGAWNTIPGRSTVSSSHPLKVLILPVVVYARDIQICHAGSQPLE